MCDGLNQSLNVLQLAFRESIAFFVSPAIGPYVRYGYVGKERVQFGHLEMASGFAGIDRISKKWNATCLDYLLHLIHWRINILTGARVVNVESVILIFGYLLELAIVHRAICVVFRGGC